MGFVFTQWVGVEERTSRTAARASLGGCWIRMTVPLPQAWRGNVTSHCPTGCSRPRFHTGHREVGLNLSLFSGLDFAGGRWGSTECRHPWQGMWMNTAEPWAFFQSFFHCCERLQPRPESRACLGQIAASPRRQALLYFLSLLHSVLGVVIWVGRKPAELGVSEVLLDLKEQ